MFSGIETHRRRRRRRLRVQNKNKIESGANNTHKSLASY